MNACLERQSPKTKPLLITLLLSSVGLLALLAVPPAAAVPPSPILAYENFDGAGPITSGKWQANTAGTPGNNWNANQEWYTLIDNVPNEQTHSAAVLRSTTELTSRCWEAEFRYRIVDINGANSDGFVFHFYKRMTDFATASYQPIRTGGFMGFETANGPNGGAVPGYGIEIDTYGLNMGDPGAPHVALIQDTAANQLPLLPANSGTSRAYPTGANQFAYNVWHQMRIRYLDFTGSNAQGGPASVNVWIDADSNFGQGAPLLSARIANPNYAHSGFGFSASTGARSDRYDIDDFVLRDLCSPGWCGGRGNDGIVVTEHFRTTDPVASNRWSANGNSGASENVWDPAQQEFLLTQDSGSGVTPFRGAVLTSSYDLNWGAREWEAEFRYQVGQAGETEIADGIVFLFYKNAPYAPGSGGSQAFDASTSTAVQGYGVELDSYPFNLGDYGSNPTDPPNVAILEDISTNHLSSEVQDSRVSDRIGHQMRINFEDRSGRGHTEVYIDNKLVLAFDIDTVNLMDYAFGGIGFSSSTGGQDVDHIIDDFTLRQCVALFACNPDEQAPADAANTCQEQLEHCASQSVRYLARCVLPVCPVDPAEAPCAYDLLCINEVVVVVCIPLGMRSSGAQGLLDVREWSAAKPAKPATRIMPSGSVV